MSDVLSVEEIKDYIEENYPTLAASRNKGELMKAVMQDLRDKVDKAGVNAAVNEILMF